MTTPPGRVPLTRELAFGMEVTLEAIDGELARVRKLLSEAAEAGDGAAASAACAASDRALANAQRRIAMVRAALGRSES